MRSIFCDLPIFQKRISNPSSFYIHLFQPFSSGKVAKILHYIHEPQNFSFSRWQMYVVKHKPPKSVCSSVMRQGCLQSLDDMLLYHAQTQISVLLLFLSLKSNPETPIPPSTYSIALCKKHS